MKNLRKGFTLVEMLIVVVIIGILAAALIPRLMGAQSSARDVARIANVKDIVTAVASYYNEVGDFPVEDSVKQGPSSTLYAKLSERKLITDIPSDPQKGTQVAGVGGFAADTNKGQYPFLKLKRNGNPDSALLVMAKVENPGKANWLVKKDSPATLADGVISNTDDVTKITLCTSVSKHDTTFATNTSACTYTDDSELRYIQFY